MQELLNEMRKDNEAAACMNSEWLTLLKKQTEFMEASLNNDKEFLSIFKKIADKFC